MTGPEREDELEHFLRQRTILPHRLAESERFEPPSDLDRVILAHAKQAIHTSEPAPVYKPTRWALPFGLAATVVISFAVILHLRQAAPPTAALTPSNPIVIDTSTASSPAPEFALQARRESAASNNAPAAAPYRAVQPALARADSEVRRAKAAQRIPAEQWLAKIERLRDEGKDADANREQAAFEKAYPHYQRSRLQDSTR